MLTSFITFYDVALDSQYRGWGGTPLPFHFVSGEKR